MSKTLTNALCLGVANAIFGTQLTQISRATELGMPPIGHPDVAAARAS